MTFGAAWLVWSTMMNFIAGIHVDADRLRFAARTAGIPEIVMEGIAAVETGYRGGNQFVGKAGEVGRMQIKASTARYVGCGEPVNLEDYEYNIACGAKILRYCRGRYKQWSMAIRCYQGMAVPEMTKDYLLKAQREIGRLTLARLDHQAVMPPTAVARAAKSRSQTRTTSRAKPTGSPKADAFRVRSPVLPDTVGTLEF
ncbi:MAG: lytic transglycosylase domain-containing protein [Gemmatimonadetes bacterium]|nr:lytic transglycosylase domain-containing protein [Gemmatimonadota bacterium]